MKRASLRYEVSVPTGEFGSSRQFPPRFSRAVVALVVIVPFFGYMSPTLAWVHPRPIPCNRLLRIRGRTSVYGAAKGAVDNQTEWRTVNNFDSLIGTNPRGSFSYPAPLGTKVDESNRGPSTTRVISETSSLGDIMSSGLSTTASDTITSRTDVNSRTSQNNATTSTLAACYGIHHPLDRMALTANGNLQRLVASYYDAPVSVEVQSCTYDAAKAAWDRVVHLRIADTSTRKTATTFCVATSVIQVHDPVCQQLVESGSVGIGQLFRFLNVLPEFQLLAAGPREGGGFWRDYRLDCPELTCRIREEFEANMWEIEL